MNRSDYLNIIQGTLATIYDKLDTFFYKNSDRKIRSGLREDINLSNEMYNITKIQRIIHFNAKFENKKFEIKNNIINQIKNNLSYEKYRTTTQENF